MDKSEYKFEKLIAKHNVKPGQFHFWARQRNKYQVSVLEAPYKQLYLKLPSSEGIFEKFSNIILKQENIYR